MEQDHDRIIRLEEQYKDMSEKVDKIMTNHLPHIQEKVDKIENKLAIWSGAIIIIGIIAPYILEKILK
ncbi:MAG: hypothetical protein WC325_09595 [Candidatus Bathyarchaeia archaeon]|jgi:hypothetical protein